MADLDNSGSLDKAEVERIMKQLFLRKPHLKNGPPGYNTPEKVAAKIFDKIDAQNTGSLTLQMLIDYMHNEPSSWKDLGLERIFESEMNHK